MTEESGVIQQFGFDSCGALDLSSSGTNSIKLSDEDTESNSDNGDVGPGFSKRKAEVLAEFLSKRKKIRKEENDNLQPIILNKRKNIRDILQDRLLEQTTREAKALEDERLLRLRCSSESLGQSSDDSDQFKMLSDGGDEDEEEDEDPNNSGMHVNDCLNVREPDGGVVVNIGHPQQDPDIRIAPQIAEHIKPHQIGGVRFLYDNVVESLDRFRDSQGLGCILAHNMGLGKTMQVISFVDVLLSETSARSVLCIVPINTLQNWLAEFNHWLPAKVHVVYSPVQLYNYLCIQGESSPLVENGVDVKHRDFKIFVLNDNYKNMQQRSTVIKDWANQGGESECCPQASVARGFICRSADDGIRALQTVIKQKI